MIKKRRLKVMSYHNLNNYIKLQMKCTIFPINMGAVLSKGGVEEGGEGGGVGVCWLDSRDPWIRQALTFLSTPHALTSVRIFSIPIFRNSL